ncbi:MAG: 6-phosphogluconolactonase [Actinobacteria bacterium]|nr:6-phosphogluconolactonase [Actinomycetota bacterium]
MATVCEVGSVPEAFADLVVQRAPRSIALSGGGTATDCYRALRARTPDWSGVEVFFGDERSVPVDHPDSNEGMARRVLLEGAIPAAIHSLATAGTTPEAAALAYDGLLCGYGPLDLVHLGLGPDGHTASLFPGSPALEVSDRLVIATGDDLHRHPRLTFTFPAIASARLVVFTVAGTEKRDALAGVLAGDVALPAARVRAGEVVFLADAAALRA